jgi:PTH1 family peptidyl-tRNA hydrolase
MKASFGSADFWRLRIGIGRPDSASERGIADWVLSDFEVGEKEIFDRALEAGAELLLLALADNPENLLPEWAKKKIV